MQQKELLKAAHKINSNVLKNQTNVANHSPHHAHPHALESNRNLFPATDDPFSGNDNNRRAAENAARQAEKAADAAKPVAVATNAPAAASVQEKALHSGLPSAADLDAVAAEQALVKPASAPKKSGRKPAAIPAAPPTWNPNE